MAALLNNFRDGFFTAFRDEKLAPDVVSESHAYRKPKLYLADARVTPAVAADIRTAVEDLMQQLGDKKLDDPAGAVRVNVLIGYFTDGSDEAS
jgi:hypothetical protein